MSRNQTQCPEIAPKQPRNQTQCPEIRAKPTRCERRGARCAVQPEAMHAKLILAVGEDLTWQHANSRACVNSNHYPPAPQISHHHDTFRIWFRIWRGGWLI
eukprot:1701541-Rhodomonas_salina.2